MSFKKSVILGVFLLLLFSMINTPVSSQSNISWWDQNYSYRQEIDVPIDTSIDLAKYQPVDIRITFKDPCFAENADEHSVRVCCWDGRTWYELESQIYDLEHSDDSHIKACSIVFLIPEFANGKEKYYVYYDDSEKQSTDYPDHVAVTKEHYYYEPIPGQKADFDYYKITDEGFCVYGIGISGMMMTEYGSQMIFRQSKGQKDLSYSYWDRLASFCFQYVDRSLPAGKDTITTRMSLISNEIYYDGNLMVCFGIISTNSRSDAKTTNLYKYYYSPIDIKRICVNVKHETLKDIRVAAEEQLDGEYAFTSGFKTRSEANIFLNTGEILPYIHFYDKDETIQEIMADTDPKSRDEEWLISVEDNSDLGSRAWVSPDSGESGKAHALIFSSNSVVKSGTDEQDGIQLKGSQKQEADIPGLQAYSSGVGCFRNAYTPGSSPDLSIPSNLVVQFDGEFYTTEIKSYNDVQAEAGIFQTLAKNRPALGGNVSGAEEKGEKYTLKVLTHFAPSFPMGSLLSTYTGKNFSCTYAELYKNESLLSTGVCGRLSLAGDMNLDFTNTTIFQKIKMIIGLFDWRNISFYKKIVFPELPPGKYVVKIYVKKGNQSKYVGVETIDLKENTTKNIYCTKQGTIKISLTDQNDKGVPNAQCYLLLDGGIVAKLTTNENKEFVIPAPRGKYQLKIMYNGFKISEKDIKIGLKQKQENFEIILSKLQLLVKDKLGLPPGIKIKPYISSDEMETPLKIYPQEEKPGVYNFINLPSATYKIQISYKSFLDEKTVRIPDDGNTVNMVFSPIFEFKTHIFDSRGNPLENTNIKIKREGITLESKTDKNGIATFNVPGGSYTVTAYDNEKIIVEKQLEVSRDESTYLVTTKEPMLPMIMIIASILIIIMGVILILLRKISLPSFLKLLALALIIIALVMPWWELSGSNTDHSVERSTKAFLIPQTMVTKTTSGSVVDAELANVPAEFTTFIFAVMIVVIAAGLLLFGSILVKKYRKTSIGLTILGIILLIITVGVFTYAFSELTEVGLGSLQGSGTLNVLKPGTNEYVDLSGNWGLSTGVYLVIAAIILVLIASIIGFLSAKKKRKKQR